MDLTIDQDIYFDPRYGKISADLESGEFREFLFNHGLGRIRHQFIIRPIDQAIAGRKKWFDITTPYGYGGPLILECQDGEKDALLEAFMESFEEYCSDNKIVSEFVRFHPIAGNALDFSSCYDITLYNYTVGTNLEDYDDPFACEFSRSCRRDVRRALRGGLVFEVEEFPETLEDFREIYIHTMERIEAKPFYMFSEDYFRRLVEEMPERILKGMVKYDSKVIAMGLFFRTNEILHDHLSGSLTEYLRLAPTYVLHHGFLCWGIENGIKLIHYGGGTSGSLCDSLYTFKKQFGQNTQFPFYFGKKIWNQKVYDQLVMDSSKSRDNNFFPRYRA